MCNEPDWTECPRCEGTGKGEDYDDSCPWCLGGGEVPTQPKVCRICLGPTMSAFCEYCEEHYRAVRTLLLGGASHADAEAGSR